MVPVHYKYKRCMYCLAVPFYRYANSILLRSQAVTSLPTVTAVVFNWKHFFLGYQGGVRTRLCLRRQVWHTMTMEYSRSHAVNYVEQEELDSMICRFILLQGKTKIPPTSLNLTLEMMPRDLLPVNCLWCENNASANKLQAVTLKVFFSSLLLLSSLFS